MKLYRWRSEALRDYHMGSIIVMAETVPDARAKAVAAAKKYGIGDVEQVTADVFPIPFTDGCGDPDVIFIFGAA